MCLPACAKGTDSGHQIHRGFYYQLMLSPIQVILRRRTHRSIGGFTIGMLSTMYRDTVSKQRRPWPEADAQSDQSDAFYNARWFSKRSAKALTRLRGCAVWSVSAQSGQCLRWPHMLKDAFSHDPVHLIPNKQRRYQRSWLEYVLITFWLCIFS